MPAVSYTPSFSPPKKTKKGDGSIFLIFLLISPFCDNSSFPFVYRSRKGLMMPRVGRIVPKDGALHIMCRGNNKQSILSQDQDQYKYYSLLEKYKEENQLDILHYCLMNNHVHLIVWLNFQSRISRFMKQVNLSYFFYYKCKECLSPHTLRRFCLSICQKMV